MTKFLRVNMASKTVDFEPVQETYRLFGGRVLIAKLLNDEINPKCDPLGPENKLIVCPGLLTGTTAPCSGRLSIGGKSPLTGTAKEANAGGTAAQMLARAGIKAVIVEGKPADDAWCILKIDKNGAELLPAENYLGLNTYGLAGRLQQDFGPKISVISIGQAGEKGYRNASIQVTDRDGRPARAAARGGLGALMGAKGLKAIVLDVTGPVDIAYADKDAFGQAARNYVEGIKANPVTGQLMPAMGTPVLVGMVNAMGILPTHNYRYGQFDQVANIAGEKLVEVQGPRGGKHKQPCHAGCVIGCSGIYNDEKGEYLTAGLEFETLSVAGSNIGLGSLDAIARLDRFCDDFGIDTMETGATIGVCMEAGKVAFGDAEGVFRLLQEMADGTEFGKILGQGTEATGKYLGVARIPTVKGQGLAGYDPRGLKGTGVTYATSPMGADHTAGNALGNPTVDPCKKEGQVALSTTLQVGMATFDSLGMCIFSGFCTDDPANVGHLLTMAASRFGGEWNPDKLFGLGVQAIALEKAFNKAAGFTAADDRLPEFMYKEPLPPNNTVFDITPEELAQAIPF